MELGVPDISPLVNENERPPGSAGEIDHVTTAPPAEEGTAGVIAVPFVRVKVLGL
tara:strand:+ start:372 stop:536 length:165 start_codon:yes stop_codon:yes gene_type:complete